MDGLLVLLVIVGTLAIVGILAAVIGADSRPEFLDPRIQVPDRTR